LFMDNTISVEEYREKKAQLLSRKVELEKDPVGSNGKWLEHFKNFLSLAHQAAYVASEANFDAQRDYFQNFGSNPVLKNRTLVFTYRYPWRYLIENGAKNIKGP